MYSWVNSAGSRLGRGAEAPFDERDVLRSASAGGAGRNERRAAVGALAHGWSMSSIKRDVKKKVLPRPEARCFLAVQPTGIWLPWRSVSCAPSDESPLV